MGRSSCGVWMRCLSDGVRRHSAVHCDLERRVLAAQLSDLVQDGCLTLLASEPRLYGQNQHLRAATVVPRHDNVRLCHDASLWCRYHRAARADPLDFRLAPQLLTGIPFTDQPGRFDRTAVGSEAALRCRTVAHQVKVACFQVRQHGCDGR
jgi:hypothetical protein